MSSTIYCVSGLGANEKIFSNLQLNGYELKHIPWMLPHKKENMQDYAGRMAEAIQHPSPVLIGVSFGGMMAIEIAKQVSLKKLVIISSVKSIYELPNWMKRVGQLRLNKVFPVRPFRLAEPITNNRLGVSSEEERIMVHAYRRAVDPVYLNWAVDQVLNWKNNWQPDNLVHIHGDKDKIFPIKKIAVNYVVKDGTHLMIYNRAGEISEFIAKSI